MGKVCTIEQVRNELNIQRRIIFTHGSFDLCHVGHASLLSESKKLGGLLVVGIDSDEGISCYKGTRSIFNQEYRAHLVSQFECVDYVVLLQTQGSITDLDYYYLKLYLILRPSIITFGSNFPFIREVEEKCRIAGIEPRKILHKYSSGVSTQAYAYALARKYIENDLGLFSKDLL